MSLSGKDEAPVDEVEAKAKLKDLMAMFGGGIKHRAVVNLPEVRDQVVAQMQGQQAAVSTLVKRSRELTQTNPLPPEIKIGEPYGRGSSHKTVYSTNDDTQVFVTVPKSDSKEVGSIAMEMDVYGRLASQGVGCPKVHGLYEFEDRIGYVATKLTGSEAKYMQLGFFRTKLLKKWKEESADDLPAYKARLNKLRDGMMGIVNSKLVFEDLQIFIGDDGTVSVFDPTGVAEVPSGDSTNYGTGEVKATAEIADRLLRALED